MFLKDKKSGDLVEVLDPKEMFNPASAKMKVRFQAGEEVGDPITVNKSGLCFPSDEALPRCWLDTQYRVKF
ncbi:MAG: acetyltransferase [Zetaproteobacteria bacterium CG06_land_8_20_14_3_00_59_53]|nr:MAG: acetyltransferase [Zetaproteobacteria bacterium CG2_30_59_37]PIO89378.1 MAG: acetyltransferase [Zetaproteobacteria bacterium CG23_combo_of_CG06-09_8_20_14_all_59_86]PIQ65686.1 MAG: acetyltransferase [Zetaproteobacteria bacterium CG11_big_fil_rev_8_21_14_0_20_59_439]PIU70716.1 MAG: acetyltransferase [Zetaproteobacteria bacterium CG06_land_8_20_14_3_00_59_53]PIU98055.1 MAG: acetyltransferase [Zetaproteobacteria bacterium CG03_land_8_20_14_0_80_59_51]PIY47891.1 MAG: acetyltransferase [Zet